MKEDLIAFKHDHHFNIFNVELAGISYCDKTYYVERRNSPYAVIEYIIEGRGTVIADDEEFYPKKGDAYILHKNSSHRYFSDDTEPWTKIWINVSGRALNSLLTTYGLEKISFYPGMNIYSYIKRIHDLGTDISIDSESKHIQACLIFHEMISFIYLSNKLYAPDISPELQAIKNYIDNSYTTKITIEDLAKKFHMSPSLLTHKFKNCFGISPYHYILDLKMNHAKSLLKNTTLKINEIATTVGFSDEHYFSYMFKNKFNITPSAYAKEKSIIITPFK